MKKTNLVTKIIIDNILGLIILGSIAFGIERVLSIMPSESDLGRLYSGLNWDAHKARVARIRKDIAEDAVSESGIKIDSRVRISPNDDTVGYSESGTVVVDPGTDDVFDVTVQYVNTSTQWQRDVAIEFGIPSDAGVMALEYVPESFTLYNALYPEGISIPDSELTISKSWITAGCGSYAPDSNCFATIKVRRNPRIIFSPLNYQFW